MDFYFKLREKLRLNTFAQRCIYVLPNLWYSMFGRLAVQVARPAVRQRASGVAICMRFRDEAPYLGEWLEYYLAAGVSKFFLYNNFSEDDYAQVLGPYVKSGVVELIEWPRKPASPYAEEDCIRQTVGRFEWVGFLDADEFVVVEDSKSIPEFLAEFGACPAVALHWYMFGSNGHRCRPGGPVIAAYTRRDRAPNFHVKCFVRPQCAAQCRNPHSWYFRGARRAVTETGRKVCGSISIPPSANRAWINHYHSKSEEDYIAKMRVKPAQDRVTILYPTRRPERLRQSMSQSNDVEDECALRYYRRRCLLSSCPLPMFEQDTAR